MEESTTEGWGNFSDYTTPVESRSLMWVDCDKYLAQLQEINGLVDEDTADFNARVEHVVNLIVLPALILVGIIGNVINLIILHKPRMRISSGIHCYLAGVAIADIGLLLCLVPNVLHQVLFEEAQEKVYNPILVWVRIVLQTPMNIFKHATTWLMVTIAVVRYVAVVRPLAANVWMTIRKAQFLTILVFTLVTVVDIPRFFQYGTCTMYDMYSLAAITSYWKTHAHKIYPSMSAVFFFIIPFILIFVFNIFLIVHVWRARRMRVLLTESKEVKSERKQELRITGLLVALILTFFVMELPEAVVTVLMGISMQDLLTQKSFSGAVGIVNCLGTGNCALNFVIYCSLSKQYQLTFRETFCCQRNRRRTPTTVLMSFRTSRRSDDTENIELNGYKKMKRNLSKQCSNTPYTSASNTARTPYVC
ncbi:PREDICTED: FMRFamide receptor-like [Priapulus caudatus]|uniref:FMRFamide receptor-like n=1 Tax=Priapulus caudatus TaxID=37621 RepID=A0ABM1E8S8_PRICU|nr:PREDICTED: FMRFamide receptor-like [Priapulus caudatus]